MIAFVTCVFIFVLCGSATGRSCDEKQSEPWSYGGLNGPRKWFKTYPECNGQLQSPIDLVQQNQPRDFGEFPRFYGYNIPLKGKVRNNGNTIEITPRDKVRRAVVVEGTNYTLTAIHFHFGADRRGGSEHIRDGRTVAMEMHLVHESRNGRTAVFSVLFKEMTYNANIEPIVDAVSKVQFMEDEAKFNKGINLLDILPNCRTTFYRYQGSLTTPPCTEDVIWTVFKYPNVIDWEQMQVFRNQRATSRSVSDEGQCFIEGNIRPQQRLNDREVTIYNPSCEVVYS